MNPLFTKVTQLHDRSFGLISYAQSPLLVREALLGLAALAKRLGEAAQSGQSYRVLHQLEPADAWGDGRVHRLCRIFRRHLLRIRRVFASNLSGSDREPDHGLLSGGPGGSLFDLLRSGQVHGGCAVHLPFRFAFGTDFRAGKLSADRAIGYILEYRGARQPESSIAV